jgi:uncharacterized protein (DUF1810 family)
MPDADPFDLARFVAAQDRLWPLARRELARGLKDSHWMWFVFPQVAGLGFSATSAFYALPSVAAAAAYLAHPVLGPRYREAVSLAVAAGPPPEAVFGRIDAVKLRSSLTLFALAAPDEPLFADALDRLFAGERDPKTLARLARDPKTPPRARR